ncbi:MAG TPA: hypothetical protein ENJ37_05420 [Deltaproteobacteria bacterium]|nr:hypothetical protein [Deltaproteobacteria bacterium]
MTFTDFIVVIIAFVLIMLLYTYADRYIRRLKADTVRSINWIGFTIAAAGGIAWYWSDHPFFMLVTFVGIIIYFLFYSYDRMEEEEKKREKERRHGGEDEEEKEENR